MHSYMDISSCINTTLGDAELLLSIHLLSTTLPFFSPERLAQGLPFRQSGIAIMVESGSWHFDAFWAPKFSQCFCACFHHVLTTFQLLTVNRVLEGLLHVLNCFDIFLPVRFGEDLEHLAELAW